jgi:hypothetical protein
VRIETVIASGTKTLSPLPVTRRKEIGINKVRQENEVVVIRRTAKAPQIAPDGAATTKI